MSREGLRGLTNGGRSANTMPAATSPMGRFSRKIQRQEAWVTMPPPTAGPMTLLMPHTRENAPCIRVR